MGLLYGQGDPMQTIVLSMRSGQDSDCNPSNAGGIIFTALDQIPAQFAEGLNHQTQFSYTNYNFDQLLDVSEKLARESILAAGGSAETDASGQEVFVIPVQTPQPAPFVQSWDPGPISGSLFTEAQMAQI